MMQNTTAEKEKTQPIWTDTINGVEVSFYRNTIKGKALPIYKVSRKKWYEKEGKWESKYSLDFGELIIAHELEARAIKDIGDYARKERAKLMTEKRSESEPIEEASAPPMME